MWESGYFARTFFACSVWRSWSIGAWCHGLMDCEKGVHHLLASASCCWMLLEFVLCFFACDLSSDFFAGCVLSRLEPGMFPGLVGLFEYISWPGSHLLRIVASILFLSGLVSLGAPCHDY